MRPSVLTRLEKLEARVRPPSEFVIVLVEEGEQVGQAISRATKDIEVNEHTLALVIDLS